MNEDTIQAMQSAIEAIEAARVHMLTIDPSAPARKTLDTAYHAAGAAMASMRQLIATQHTCTT